MRRARWLALALLPGCLGRGGPDLPENLGQTHDHERRASAGGAAGAVAPEPEPEPVEVGTPVWAELRSTGFYLHGVVVERRDARHRVVFLDGATEWVTAAALRPDSLGEGAHVDVRPSYAGSYSEAIVARRLADVVYVRFANGDEEWAALAFVRFGERDEGTPRRGEPTVAARPGGLELGASVLVNYAQGGLQFAGTITARADDGRLHVVYLDSTAEWVEPALVVPETLSEGALVHVRRRWEPPDWVRGRIYARQGHALSVELEDGGVAWTSLFRVRAPLAPESPQQVDSVSDSGEEQARP